MDDDRQACVLADELIMRHEGFTRYPSRESNNRQRVGYGTNLELRGLSEDEAKYILLNDVGEIYKTLSNYPFFDRLTPTRRAVLIDIAYDLGGLFPAKFHQMLNDLSWYRYEMAADAIEASDWGKQNRTRAQDNAHLMRRG